MAIYYQVERRVVRMCGAVVWVPMDITKDKKKFKKEHPHWFKICKVRFVKIKK